MLTATNEDTVHVNKGTARHNGVKYNIIRAYSFRRFVGYMYMKERIKDKNIDDRGL